MSDHYYTTDGEPCHTQIIKSGKNKGKPRATNLRDARKLNLLPSVSAYTGMLAKPFLVDWKARQVLAAAYDNPAQTGETPERYISRVQKIVSDAFTDTVQDRGSLLHAEIEAYFTSDRGEIVSQHHDFIAPVIEIVESMESGIYAAEKVVVAPHDGYAGTADIILESGQIVDFKSKDFKGREGGEHLTSFENAMQLSAYYFAHNADALNIEPCWNIYFDRTAPGQVYVKEWSVEELESAWSAFISCLQLYRITKNFDPRQ